MLHNVLNISTIAYHPAAQDWFPTEAKQGWAGQYLDERENSWEN